MTDPRTTPDTLPRGVKHDLALHIDRKWTQRDGGCPMCGGTVWDADGYVNFTCSRVAGGESIEPTPRGFVAAAVVCKGCGFVAMLNLDVAGIPTG